MLSAKEAAAQRRALTRDIEVHHRREAAEKVRSLRAHLKDARAKRNEALTRVKCHCRAARAALRERAEARRKAALVELRDTYAQERAQARATCLVQKAAVHAEARDPIERARGQWDAERTYQADLRRIERGNRERHRAVHKAHADERRSESDDEVMGNIPPSYAALFQRVKRSIKGTARESRTEAFLRYVEENPHEVAGALDDDSDRVIRQLEAERAKAERAARPPPPSRRRYSPEELASVPF